MSEVDLKKTESVPPGIQRFHEYAGVPAACPHPSAVLDELVPEYVMKAFIEVMNASNVIVREEKRRVYMAILADEVMNQNPIAIKKIGPRVKHAGQNTDV